MEVVDLENKNAEIASFPQTTEAMRHHYAINPFLVSHLLLSISLYYIDLRVQIHSVSVRQLEGQMGSDNLQLEADFPINTQSVHARAGH